MPLYEFYCDNENCKGYENIKEVKMSISEKENSEVKCSLCGSKMTQKVSQLKFKLSGTGWHSDSYGNNSLGTGYGITEMEQRKNLDTEKKLEDKAYSENYKDNVVRKRG